MPLVIRKLSNYYFFNEGCSIVWWGSLWLKWRPKYSCSPNNGTSLDWTCVWRHTATEFLLFFSKSLSIFFPIQPPILIKFLLRQRWWLVSFSESVVDSDSSPSSWRRMRNSDWVTSRVATTCACPENKWNICLHFYSIQKRVVKSR